MLTSKEKLIKYLSYKGISQDKFSRSCGVSSGFLRQGKSFSIEYLKNIRDNYTDLNIDWLVYDEGNMLLNEQNQFNETEIEYNKPCKNCESLEKLLEAKEETIAILKHQLGIGNGNGSSKAS